MKVFSGDQYTLREMFCMWYKGLETSSNDLWKWLIPIACGFNCDKERFWSMLKWFLSGRDCEEFLQDSDLSDKQCEHFLYYKHAVEIVSFSFNWRVSPSSVLMRQSWPMIHLSWTN